MCVYLCIYTHAHKDISTIDHAHARARTQEYTHNKAHEHACMYRDEYVKDKQIGKTRLTD
jgi:hypothetical protein